MPRWAAAAFVSTRGSNSLSDMVVSSCLPHCVMAAEDQLGFVRPVVEMVN
jgi:hypothetical protein